MARVLIHATVTLDGFMADPDGGIDWMFGFPSAPEDDDVVQRVWSQIGAVVGGANATQTIDDGELPYGGLLKVPVFLMTHSAHDPVERDGVTYSFVVDDITEAVELARQAAGEQWVSLLGGRIARQCLARGLVDEILRAAGTSRHGGVRKRDPPALPRPPGGASDLTRRHRAPARFRRGIGGARVVDVAGSRPPRTHIFQFREERARLDVMLDRRPQLPCGAAVPGQIGDIRHRSGDAGRGRPAGQPHPRTTRGDPHRIVRLIPPVGEDHQRHTRRQCFEYGPVATVRDNHAGLRQNLSVWCSRHDHHVFGGPDCLGGYGGAGREHPTHRECRQRGGDPF
jgi:dihydrofolate reductase